MEATAAADLSKRQRLDRNFFLAIPPALLAVLLFTFYASGILIAGLAGAPTWWYGLLSLGGSIAGAWAILKGQWIVKILSGSVLLALLFAVSNLALFLGIIGLYTIVVPIKRPQTAATPIAA